MVTSAYTSHLTRGKLALIGSMTQAWTQIEFAIDQTLLNLTGLTHAEAKLALTFNSMDTRATMYAHTTKRLVDPGVAELAQACVPHLKRLASDRALIVHGMWLLDYGVDRTKTVQAKSLRNIAREGVNADQLARVYEEMANLSNAVVHVMWYSIHESAGYEMDEPPPWHNRWLQGSHPCPNLRLPKWGRSPKKAAS